MPEEGGLHERLRPVLRAAALRGTTVTYRELAAQAGVAPPHTIHKATAALENLAREDHDAGRPLLAALAVGKAGLPGPGFFHLLRELGRYDGPDHGPAAAAHHARELDDALAYWAGAERGSGS